MLLLRYEDLKVDLRNQLHRLSTFLQVNITAGDIENTLLNSEGSYHRNNSNARIKANVLNFYTPQMQLWMNKTINHVEQILASKFDILGFYNGTGN